MTEGTRARLLIVAAESHEVASALSLSEATVALETAPDLELNAGYLAGQPMLLVRSGVGKVRSARATQHVLERHGPVRAVVMVGAAGALAPDLAPGDVVVAERVVAHDLLFVTPNGEIPASLRGRDGAGNPAALASIACDRELVALAHKAAGTAVLRAVVAEHPTPSVRFGVVATGDQFVARLERKRWILEQFGALACNQEGAAVAQVCLLEGVPFLEVRGISDVADDTVEIDPARVHRYADQYEAARIYGEPGTRSHSALTEPLCARLKGAGTNAALLLQSMLRLDRAAD